MMDNALDLREYVFINVLTSFPDEENPWLFDHRNQVITEEAPTHNHINYTHKLFFSDNDGRCVYKAYQARMMHYRFYEHYTNPVDHAGLEETYEFD